MRGFLTASLLLLCAPALAQEDCRYRSGDGLSAKITGERLEIYGSDGSYTRCDVAPTEFKTMNEVRCPEFTGDLFLLPKEPMGDFAEIIVMPPNVLYWTCAVQG